MKLLINVNVSCAVRLGLIENQILLMDQGVINAVE